MKVATPFSLKVALWLLLNLVVLVGAGVVFVVTQYGIGWESLIDSRAGNQVRELSDRISAEMRADPGQSTDALLARYGPGAGIESYLFLNEGSQIGGESVTLPPVVFEELKKTGPLADLRPPARPDRRGDGPPPLPAALRARGGFVQHAGSAYWIGQRMPVPSMDAGMPRRGTLLLRVPSVFGMLRLLDFLPWLAAVGTAFVLSVLCWLPFVTSLRHDLLALSGATERIAEGRFDTRVSIGRGDELGTLGNAVNRMAERLDSHAQGQKRFLGDVAHELGSPLARLQVAVELLERRADDNLKTQIGDVRDEVQQIAALVNELLAFTKAGLRPRPIDLAKVELAPLVREIAQREDPLSRATLTVPDSLTVRADAGLLARAVGNLLRNALKYAGDNAAVRVSAASDNGKAVLCIEDDGPGVPPDALERLGEPFFRPEAARTRETGGVGLGLAIVRSSVAVCGGEVRFANRTPHGFLAEIRLDRA